MNFKQIYWDAYGATPHKSIVFHADGSVARQVQNLGWLIRHWKDVKSFDISEGPVASTSWDAVMVAHLNNGGAYVTTWADKTVLRDWLHRPVFRGAPLNWFGQKTQC
jgi:hypothetical protein